MKEKLRDESGSSIDAVINQDQNADIDIDSVIGKDPYAQDKLEELGYSDQEVDSEYALAR